MADQEIARKSKIAKSFDYLCQQLEALVVAKLIPDDVEQCDTVINRAIDVRSACMLYLESHIRHDATLLGTMGNSLI